ncbi:MAG: ATP-binding protein, partial [Candidatus Thorarchaeota archaeon]
EKIVLELNSHLIKDKQGNPVRIDGTFIDITEKFTLEHELKESEEKYRFFYEFTPFSIVIINSKGKIVDCNPTTKLMLGYSKEDLVGHEFHKISVIHPNYLPKIMELFQKFIKGERIHRIDIEMYKKDRSLIWVNLQASLIQIEREYYVHALFNDITKRKQAELLVNEEITKLKELDQLRKNLISRVSHELKTPIATVCGGAELFSNYYNTELKNEQIELLKLIEKGGDRLKFLVDNLIDITKIEYSKFELNKKRTDLSELIKESTNEMLHFANKRMLFLDLEIKDNIYLDIDRIRIEQVIMNLLSNAIKNTPSNGKISIKLERIDNWAQFTITDTGVGLTKDEMNILFTRFGKIERYGNGLEYINIQGSGLGLFISKEIVDLHGGNIRAESEGRNKGSSFIVKLPLD